MPLKSSLRNGESCVVQSEISANPLIFSLFIIYRYTIYKDHITLGDYEIHDGMSLEMY